MKLSRTQVSIVDVGPRSGGGGCNGRGRGNDPHRRPQAIGRRQRSQRSSTGEEFSLLPAGPFALAFRSLEENAADRRVLIVDDHEPWRRKISSMLREDERWQVVGEASDGLEAIQKAEELRPDLILLDVELPALSGIEAARRILARDPSSRILFVSAHRSWDIAAAALVTGARGYVIKLAAGDELLPAMEAIVKGKRFVSAIVTGRTFDGKMDERDAHWPCCHEAGFFSEDTFLLDAFARFAEAALSAGKAVIVLTVESRRNELHQRLQAHGLDIDLAIKEGRYISLDVADALSSYMVDGWPDETRFWKAGTSLIVQAARASRGEHPRVAACGECAVALLRDGRVDAAIQLEHLWNELASTYNVDVFCGYSTGILPDEDAFQRICKEHSAVHSR